MAETNTSSSPIEKAANPEREAVVSLIHHFYQERQKNTPAHRRYFPLWEKRSTLNPEEQQEAEKLRKEIIETKKTTARELLQRSDTYSKYLGVGEVLFTFSGIYDNDNDNDNHTYWSTYKCTSSDSASIYFDTTYKGRIQSLLSELKDKYQITDEEWQNLTKLAWTDDEKTQLTTLMRNYDRYREELKEEDIAAEGHTFRSGARSAIMHALRDGYLTNRYEALKLPEVHRDRVITEMLIGQFEL